MFTTYDPSLHITLSCNDQEYLSALNLFEAVCAPSIFPFSHQLNSNVIGELQQKWFARCLQEVLALHGDARFFPVPLNNWRKMAESSIEQEAMDLYRKTRPQYMLPSFFPVRRIA